MAHMPQGVSQSNYQQSGNPTPVASVDNMDNPDNQQFATWLSDVAELRSKQSFACLFKWFGPKIQRVARQKLGCDQLALEALQETMTNIWRKAHLFDATKGNASTWIYTVMRNVIFDALRKIKSNQKETLSEDIYPLAEDIMTEGESFSDHLLSNKLKHVVDALPHAQQQVVRAIYFHEMTHEQLAKQLNVPVGTVKSRLRLALNRLKKHMSHEEDMGGEL
jgi:RNA polymerase sigma-70 factor (ECF subfamily)